MTSVQMASSICYIYINLLPQITNSDALAGHDPKDSTTVSDPFVPVELPDEVSVKDIHVGIPQVSLTHDVTISMSQRLSRVLCSERIHLL